MDLMHLAVIAMLFSGLWAVKVLYLSLFLEGVGGFLQMRRAGNDYSFGVLVYV